MRKTLVTVLSLMMVFAMAGATAEGTLRVAMECDYAPYNWMQAKPSDFAVAIEGEAGYADGYDVQIAKKIADGLDKELVIVKCEWDGLAMGVVNDVFDLIIAGMSPTPERKMTIDFSDPYYHSQLVLVVRADSPYAEAKSLADFSGATVTGQLNTFHYSVIDQIPNVNQAMAMNTFPEMVVALKSSVIDAYVAEEPGAVANTTANPELTYVRFEDGMGFTASEEDTTIAIGLKMGSDLLEPINAILSEIDDATRLQMMLDATDRQPLNQ